MNAENEDLILNTTIRSIDENTPSDLHRPHLGMSQIGKPDDRALWLSFRWSLPDDTSARVRRIFRLGHLIEAEVIELLSRIPGAKVIDRVPGTGQQFNFIYVDGHFGGSMDACMLGVPEAPKTWHVIEIKTVNGKRFKELQKSRVEAFSPEYYAQMQCYMGASGMERALFVAYCKDTSELYTERLHAKKIEFSGYLARAERIIMAIEPPSSIYKDADDFEAKKAGATSRVYWGQELPPPNCRNCRFSSPVSGGQWDCDFHRKTISIDDQRKGCANHNYMPCLMPKPAMHIKTYADCVEYEIDGIKFWNAESIAGAVHEDVYNSAELHHMSKSDLASLTKDKAFSDIREKFSATVTSHDAASL